MEPCSDQEAVGFSCAELEEFDLPGPVKTERGWRKRAEREGWAFVDVPSPGRRASTRLFTPPPAVMALISARKHGKSSPGDERGGFAARDVHKPYVVEGVETERPYVAPDWTLLEALLRVAEHKLKGAVTKDLADRIDQVVAAWGPVADERPDLAARLARVKAAADLLRPFE